MPTISSFINIKICKVGSDVVWIRSVASLSVEGIFHFFMSCYSSLSRTSWFVPEAFSKVFIVSGRNRKTKLLSRIAAICHFYNSPIFLSWLFRLQHHGLRRPTCFIKTFKIWKWILTFFCQMLRLLRLLQFLQPDRSHIPSNNTTHLLVAVTPTLLSVQ